MKNKYKLVISYDGFNYCGWQIQKNSSSIQGIIEKQLSKICKEKIKLIAAGRTDAKVHAKGQVAHFTTNQTLDIKKIFYCINRLLPKDIKVLSMKKTKKSFHARFSATSKVYQYSILKHKTQDPFLRFYAYKLIKEVDLDLLKKAAQLFIGKKNFVAFANNQNEGSAKTSPIKTIKRLDIKNSKKMIVLEFEGDGFLYKMVRNIVSTLIEIATKKLPLNTVNKIFTSQDRKKAPSPVPGYGLCLVKVNYKQISSKEEK